jgi:hypothetical protein
MNLLNWEMCTVLWRTATAISMANKEGVFFIIALFAVALVAAAGVIQSK